MGLFGLILALNCPMVSCLVYFEACHESTSSFMFFPLFVLNLFTSQISQDAYMNNQKFLTSEPTITRFLAPPFWNVATPRIDYNGASGTIQINNYGKGFLIHLDTESPESSISGWEVFEN